MDSRECSTIFKSTFGCQYQASELDYDTTTSTTFTSIDSMESQDLFDDKKKHVKGCTFKYTNICSCEVRTRYCRTQNKRLAEKNQSMSSTILAGNVGIMLSSHNSSDSYHSAVSGENFDENADEIEVTNSKPNNSMVSNAKSSMSRLNVAMIEPRRRDTNHNINSAIKSENYDIMKFPTLQAILKDRTNYMMPFLEKLAEEIEAPPDEFDNRSSKFLEKRLSAQFLNDPREFREKLLTIIEESDLTADLQARIDNKLAINLSRFTTEFKRGCKYFEKEVSMEEEVIEDCTAPSFIYKVSPVNLSHHKMPQTFEESPKTPFKRRSSVDFHTPIRQDPYKQPKVYRKTPKIAVESFTKSNHTPLRIAALKKASGSPIILQTPNYISSNDSFAYWENFAEQIATPESRAKEKNLRKSLSMPNLSVQMKIQEIKQKVNHQLKLLEDSPTATSRADCDLQTSIQSDDETFNSHQGPTYDFADSILEEVMKKRARCCETERTLREIEANSVSDLAGDENHLLEYFEKFVDDASNYHTYLLNNKEKIVDEIEKKLTPKIIRSAKKPTSSSRSALRSHKSNTPAKTIQPAACKTPNRVKRPSFIVNIRKKSPNANISKAVNQRLVGYSGHLSAKKMNVRSTSPAPKTPGAVANVGRRLVVARSAPNLAVTPKPALQTISSIKTPGLLDLQKTPSRGHLSGRTPSKVTSLSVKTPSKLTPLTQKPSKAPLKIPNYLSCVQTPSNATSSVKTPTKVVSSRKTPSRLMKSRSPVKLSVSSRSNTDSKSNSMTTSSKILRTPRLKFKTSQQIPSLQITPATPHSVTKSPLTSIKSSLKLKKSALGLKQSSSVQKKSEKLCKKSPTEELKVTYKSSLPSTPVNSSDKPKFFAFTPETATSKVRGYIKNGKFFDTPVKTDEEQPKHLVFPGSAFYYGYSTVKSPVAEYIHSTDPKFLQKTRGKDNKLLIKAKPKNFKAACLNLGAEEDKKNIA